MKSVLKFGGSVGPGSAGILTLLGLLFENLSTDEFVTAIAWLAKIAIDANALTEGCVISIAGVFLFKQCVSWPFL